MTPPNVYAFIDGTNLHIAVREQGWILHCGRFRKYLKDRFGVTKAFYFIGYVQSRTGLYKSLRKSGYKMVFKPTFKDKNGKIKGNVDAELILKALILCHKYQKAIIVSGDGDYYCLIKFLKRQKKLLKIIIPDRNNYSWLLRRFSKDIIYMNEMKEKLKYADYNKNVRGIPSGQNLSGNPSS